MTGLIILIDTCWNWLEDQLTLPVILNNNICIYNAQLLHQQSVALVIVLSTVYYSCW
jgi:hypothetical protein